MPATLSNLPQVEITSRAGWRAWLQKNHKDSTGIWLVTYKKAAGEKHVPYSEVVEEALCFGWVDSLGGKVDAERSKLFLAPRRKGSVWSALNKTRVARLVADGIMTPAGLEKIEAAKADGSWDTLNRSDAGEEPADLAAAFKKNPQARRHWNAFPPSARKVTLEWIYAAKRSETHAVRIAETVRLCAENIRPRQWTPKA